ncbi:MFS transporter [Nocardioides marmoribigeumensis]|uniref:MFS family permease n=1 Tax=Nocardioides marmoribigeumensis TaxID=433649 RepID=A0ABU2C0F8_9ACTN|nr:MFS transporter [Nocardioides marmoribigeumensis]MDR7364126.1 MFS family permease [Nocardioides marmoribigeumensis]
MRLPDSFGLLRQRDFGWFFASRTVNLLGLSMANVALAFAVLDLDGGSASELGVVLAAHTVPMVLFLLVGGVVADRWPRTLVMQGGNLVSAASQGVLAALVVAGRADVTSMVVLSAVHGLASAVSFPAMAGLLPQLVERRELQRANVLLSVSRGALTVVGPSIAALLVVAAGPGWALAVDALCWALSAGALLGVRVPRAERPADPPSALADLREGWDLFRSTTWLWVVVAGFSVLNALQSGAWLTLGPAQAKRTFGEQGWGLVLSAESVGLLLMTAIMLRVRLDRPLRWGVAGIALAGVPLVLLGSAPVLWLVVAAAVLAGMGFEIFNLGWNLAMQEHVEEHQLSRAYSYDALGSYVAMPVGQLALGPLGEALGYGPVLVGAGMLWVAACGLVLTSRPVRDLARAPVAEDALSDR